MNEYVGKICPFCKTPFTENDDIVVCSVCDMPHHKDCWIENQGCTTFGCMGTIKAVDGSPTSVTATTLQYDDNAQAQTSFVYCTRCGTQNVSTSSFCCKCGNPLQAIPQQHSKLHFSPAGTVPQSPYGNSQQSYQLSYYNSYATSGVDTEMAIYIGNNSEYYTAKFNVMKSQNKKNTGNWCAFLFAPYWFIYRKMYGYGAAILGGVFILSLLGWFGSLLSFGGYITFGILGNYIYLQQVEKNVQQGKALSEPYKSQHISKVGGVNTTATVLTVIGYAILVSIINFA